MQDLDVQMHKVWKVEQEILDVVHSVCVKNDLRYALYYGTLLGAVRHKGFIPWDDDIDIIMPREDYEKLIALWKTEAPANYVLQNYYTDPDTTNNFTKIRKDHTTFIQDDEEREKKYHKGIFIDIFPVDRMAPGRIGAKLQYVGFAVNLLFTRGYTSGTGGVIGAVERLLLGTGKSGYARKRNAAEAFVKKWNGRTGTKYVCSATIRDCRLLIPADAFEGVREIEFMGKMYHTVADPDEHLKIQYGDYMQLPPEEQRKWFHHPLLIDFERNYEELLSQQTLQNK